MEGGRNRPPLITGLRQEFSSDFSGVAPYCKKGCLISRVVQRARLEVDELGTTAPAATVVVVARMISYHRPRPQFQMVMDRPFLVAIQHVPTGTLLFAGVVGDPTG